MRRAYSAVIAAVLLQVHYTAKASGNMSGGGGDPLVATQQPHTIFCEMSRGGWASNGPSPGRSIYISPLQVVDNVQKYDISLTNPSEKVIATGNPWNLNLLTLEWPGATFRNDAWHFQSDNGSTETFRSRAEVTWGERRVAYRCFTSVEKVDCSIVNCCPGHPTSCGAN